MRRNRLLPSTMASFFIVLTGCSHHTGPTSSQPVTLRISMPASGWLTPEEFDRYIIGPVAKRFPHMTIEKLESPNNLNAYQKLITSGTIPDIAITSTPVMSDIRTVGLTENIEPLIKKYNADLKRLEPVAIESVKIACGGEYLCGLPYTRHFNALYYNKNIFDRFGVAYPKEGMTWEDVRELAVNLTRSDGGIQYRGMEPDIIVRPASSLSLGFVDPQSSKAIVNTEQWKYVFETIKTIYDIPSNAYSKKASDGMDEFFKDQKLAMISGLNWLDRVAPVSEHLNWDMVSYPSFKNAPGIGTGIDAHLMVITPGSKNQDAAFQVLQAILSDEVQTDISRNGRISVLKDEKMKTEFGKNIAFLKGKNVQAAFKTTPAKPYPPTPFDQSARVTINSAMDSIVLQGTDVNTALRNAEEQINQYIEQNKKK